MNSLQKNGINMQTKTLAIINTFSKSNLLALRTSESRSQSPSKSPYTVTPMQIRKEFTQYQQVSKNNNQYGSMSTKIIIGSLPKKVFTLNTLLPSEEKKIAPTLLGLSIHQLRSLLLLT